MYLVTLPCLSCMAYSEVSTPEIEFTIGGVVQPIYYFTDNEIVSARDQHDFKIRRARLSAKANIDQWINTVIQTEYSENPTSSAADMRIIDAYAFINLSSNTKFYAGQFLAPALRQNITSTSALMTLDRPGVSYKSLSWGTRAMSKFTTTTMGNTDAGLRGNVDVRDIGAMILRTGVITKDLSYKYYLGIFEGAQSAQSERFVLRSQFNLGDTESGHFNKSSYYGSINTLALGFSYDVQAKVAVDTESEKDVNYRLFSIDFFAEKPVGAMSLSIEAAWIDLDLNNAGVLMNPESRFALSNSSARKAQGSGYYFQSGLTIANIQPWLGYENWTSDDESGAGSYNGARLGLSYLLNSRANIKAGFERIEADEVFDTLYGSTKKLDSFSLGLFLTF